MKRVSLLSLRSRSFGPSSFRLLPAVSLVALAALASPVLAQGADAPIDKLPSGVVVKHTRVGNGPMPAASDTVKVHYRGTLANGTEFDSSYKRGEPATFPLNRVVPCWTEGLQKI